jgi:hypothetical protein
VIERFNRTVANMGQTVLSKSTLPKSFWGFAFIWATHLLNQMPNKTSGDKTLYEALFNRVPRFDGFCVFGSKAYIQVPPEKRRKLDDRAIEAVVVGHLAPSKGWLFYIPTEDRFELSSMVSFVDSICLDTLVTSIIPKMSELRKNDPHLVQHLKPPEEPNSRKALFEHPTNKMDLKFIANQLTLGDFRMEHEFGNQELLIDAILRGCEFFGVNIPRTY